MQEVHVFAPATVANVGTAEELFPETISTSVELVSSMSNLIS